MTMTTDKNVSQNTGTRSVEYAIRELMHEWAEDGVDRFRAARVVEALDHPEVEQGQHIRAIMSALEREGLVETVSPYRGRGQYRLTVDAEPSVPERFQRPQCTALTARYNRRCRNHAAPGFDLCHQHLRRRDTVETIDESDVDTEEESDA